MDEHEKRDKEQVRRLIKAVEQSFIERLERNRPEVERRLERAVQAAKEFRIQLEETAYLLRLAAWKFCEARHEELNP
jgi:hypothetical protein